MNAAIPVVALIQVQVQMLPLPVPAAVLLLPLQPVPHQQTPQSSCPCPVAGAPPPFPAVLAHAQPQQLASLPPGERCHCLPLHIKPPQQSGCDSWAWVPRLLPLLLLLLPPLPQFLLPMPPQLLVLSPQPQPQLWLLPMPPQLLLPPRQPGHLQLPTDGREQARHHVACHLHPCRTLPQQPAEQYSEDIECM